MQTRRLLWIALFAVASCGNRDDSATDKTSEDLRKAHEQVVESSKQLAKNQDEIEQKKRDLLREQQELADKQKLIEQQQQQLGSAQTTLAQARVAYAAAVKERYAKLDALVSSLGTKTDAKSKDAVIGLRARQTQLSAKIDAMPATPDADWTKYTKDLDVTFDAIEDDTHKARK
ncbi:MAG TPA: hypothetical protein VGM39_06495 [Kofleriaceae bacterium]|jgi:chromosome segregation ATPase